MCLHAYNICNESSQCVENYCQLPIRMQATHVDYIYLLAERYTLYSDLCLIQGGVDSWKLALSVL